VLKDLLYSIVNNEEVNKIDLVRELKNVAPSLDLKEAGKLAERLLGNNVSDSKNLSDMLQQIIDGARPPKIELIKELRHTTDLGLKEAKELADRLLGDKVPESLPVVQVALKMTPYAAREILERYISEKLGKSVQVTFEDDVFYITITGLIDFSLKGGKING